MRTKEEREGAKKKAEERAKKMELAKKRENTSRKRTKSSGGAEAKKRSSSVGSSSSVRRSPSRGKENESEQEIDSDECCVCFRTFQDDQREGTGLEWVQSAKDGSMRNVSVRV